MLGPAERALLEETVRRLRVQAQPAAEPVLRAIRQELFAEQLALIDDPSREKAALCTRRAGKTETDQRYAPLEAMKHPGSLVRIWGITRMRCKELMWLPLKYLFERHKVAVKANDTELRIFLSNRSEIRLVGADKDKEAQKKRGDKTRLEIILEAQAFGGFLKSLVEDVVEPCTADVRGTMLLEGTPGPICAGHWFSMTGSLPHATAKRWESPGRLVDGQREGQGWSCHRWGVLDNPYMRHMLEDLPKLKAKRGWDDEHPTWLREWRAQWVNDEGALFYAFDATRNLHRKSEDELRGPGWLHVLGWDLGANDDMAKVVWAWRPEEKVLYEAFSWKRPGAGLAECHTLDKWLHERFNIIAQVADTGGGGKMMTNEYAARFPEAPAYEPAKKTEKPAHVRLFNDDMRAGNVKLRDGSPLHQEMSVLPKDTDIPPELPPVEDPRFPNHCCDGGLYGWRRAYHYLHEAEEERPPPRGTPAAAEREAVELERREVEQAMQAETTPWWEEA